MKLEIPPLSMERSPFALSDPIGTRALLEKAIEKHEAVIINEDEHIDVFHLFDWLDGRANLTMSPEDETLFRGLFQKLSFEEGELRGYFMSEDCPVSAAGTVIRDKVVFSPIRERDFSLYVGETEIPSFVVNWDDIFSYIYPINDEEDDREKEIFDPLPIPTLQRSITIDVKILLPL